MTTPPPPQSGAGLHNKVSLFAYLFLCLNVLIFSFLIAANPEAARGLAWEDSWVESLTALWFLLAGVLLFAAAWKEPGLFRRCVYILGGLAMVFVVGEEVSWGQRVFGFETPGFLASLNEQNEFTVHNTANGLLTLVYLNGGLLLCMATCAAFFCRKDRLFGIPLPSVLLMLGLLIILSYESGAWLSDALGTSFREYLRDIRRSFGFIVIEEKALLLLFFIFTLFAGRVKLVVASVATLALVFALSYVNYENVNYVNRIDRGSMFEIREYLFAIACFFYSLELALAQGPLAAILRKPFSRLKLPEGRVPLWLMACSLVIAGSAALMLFQFFNAGSQADAPQADAPQADVINEAPRPVTDAEPQAGAPQADAPQADVINEANRSISAAEPLIRSTFNVYLIEDELIYAKEPCAPADTEAAFFLHLYPVDANDLPGPRRQYGYDNLDFRFADLTGGAASGGKCLAIKPLPGYAISEILTGQFVETEGGSTHRLWEEKFLLDSAKSGAAE